MHWLGMGEGVGCKHIEAGLLDRRQRWRKLREERRGGTRKQIDGSLISDWGQSQVYDTESQSMTFYSPCTFFTHH